MHTMMALLALAAGTSVGRLSGEPAWLTDYAQAMKHVATAQKPMAVFVGNGPDGWAKVVSDGLDPAAKKLLAEKFVCVYADTDTAAGKSLAGAFEVSKGLIISDRTGERQAYRLSGTLTQAELSRTLEKYRAAKDIQTTETVVRGAPAASYPQYQPYPQYQLAPGFRPGGT